MAKIVTVTLDPKTCKFSVDNAGFEGKGCTAITQEFAKGNKVELDRKKPEFKRDVKTQVCK